MSDTVPVWPFTAKLVSSEQMADLRGMTTSAIAEKHIYAVARRRLRSAYNNVSDTLGSSLHLDGRIWELAWPGGSAPSEQMITDALIGVLDADAHGDATIALRLQRVLFARGPAPVREYYSERLLRVVPMPRGRLGPDLVLDGRTFFPGPLVPNVFVGR